LNSVKGDPRLKFPLKIVFCAVFSKIVSFDANFHPKHENQVVSAISVVVSKLFKFSVEAGKMMRELFVKKIPSYVLKSG